MSVGGARGLEWVQHLYPERLEVADVSRHDGEVVDLRGRRDHRVPIACMHVLPAAAAPAIYAWISCLSYPWSSLAEVSVDPPALPEVAAVLEALREE